MFKRKKKQEEKKPECGLSPLKAGTHDWELLATFPGVPAKKDPLSAEILVEKCKNCYEIRARLDLRYETKGVMNPEYARALQAALQHQAMRCSPTGQLSGGLFGSLSNPMITFR